MDDRPRFVVCAVLFVLVIGQTSGAGRHARSWREDDTTVDDGGTYLLGQVLSTDRYGSNDSVDLERADGTHVTAARVGDDGTLAFDTGVFSPGKYTLTSSTGPTITFDLVRQTYSIEPDRDGVPAVAIVDVAVQSNRDNYTHVIRSPDVNVATLRTVFDGAGTVGPDAETIRIPGCARRSLSANFIGLAPGTYRLVFAADTGASERIPTTVDDSGVGQVTLGSRIVYVEVGDVITVALHFRATDTVRLTVGSVPLAWKVTPTVTNADADGSAAVRVDTATARQSGTVFTPIGPDTASNVTVTRGTRFADPDRRIAAEAYPFSVETDGWETDVGTLSLRPATGVDRICNRSAGALVDAYDDNADAVSGLLSGPITGATVRGIVTDAGERDDPIVAGADRHVSTFRTGAPDDASVVLETTVPPSGQSPTRNTRATPSARPTTMARLTSAASDG